MLSRSLCTDRPDGALVLVVSEAPDEEFAGEPGLPHRGLVWEMVKALAGYAVPVGDAVLVRDGRWWSYDCPDHCCDPGRGTPLPAGVTELEVASIATGTVVEAPARTSSPASPHRPRIAGPWPTRAPAWPWSARPRSWTSAARRSPPSRGRPSPQRWRGAGRARPADRLTDAEVARVVCGLRDGDVRDLAFGLALGAEPAAAEQLWTECTRRAPAPLDAAPATLLAVSAWLRGDGAMANVALARALDSDPGYALRPAAERRAGGLHDAVGPPRAARRGRSDATGGLTCPRSVGPQSSSGRSHSSPRTCSARKSSTVSYQTSAFPGVSTQWFSSGK